MSAAKKLKFETKAIQADMSLFDIKDLPLPMIVHVIKDGDLPHFCVVVRVLKDKLVIADPDMTIGVTKMSRAQFEQEWHCSLHRNQNMKQLKKTKIHCLHLCPAY
ncbi:cysteine peptidase family C39 domain-containing protein [Lactiplantibacillus mudanjiangensis]|uniref:Bacteriocin ABC-transporter, ATP-binding and permease protein PlnG [Lactobacillus plantarum ZJ316] n=1 Tax=Lactiplantibacillus mudanjiangensis TaxID=1296538 RepID=A0A660DZZ4_9LACO|nr:cysteine peptidase family C39 domain-containing protein [Lactiplantibacillus mudanjiangensis]VDG25082.1 Bacteriocin ABC-transporter, ATP-binding and permease protein PlnG [Lactobacillus plantarum ZJ316] [Lactiplantibacillus mudanjiangensis]VDG29012.1 Bacteriocin ABC-transporter, ATP-binding and permease protein PlnG [Lactobacillus plantarum ZJ316] [Lactiplantibacillus mudanjiangensis]